MMESCFSAKLILGSPVLSNPNQSPFPQNKNIRRRTLSRSFYDGDEQETPVHISLAEPRLIRLTQVETTCSSMRTISQTSTPYLIHFSRWQNGSSALESHLPSTFRKVSILTSLVFMIPVLSGKDLVSLPPTPSFSSSRAVIRV